MKHVNISHWDFSNMDKGLLFFAQVIEEMLFHYGHDSLKVPALNFRFLCFEIRNSIEKIESDIVDKGNMRPLFDELKETFENDPIVKKLFGSDFNSLFYTKNAEGDILRNCSDIFKDPTGDTSIKRIKRVVHWLINEMDIEDRYFLELKASITECIKAVPFSFSEQEQLYRLSRILITDLINFGYSQEYIYQISNDIFYNSSRPVTDIDTTLTSFWESFDFEAKEYIVTLPLKTSYLKKHLRYFNNVFVKYNKAAAFNNSCRWVVEVPIKAMDPQQAHANAIKRVNFYASLIQYNNHRSKPYREKFALVTQKESGRTYHLKTPIALLERGSVLSDEKNNEKIALMVSNFTFSPLKMTSVIELHSSAISSLGVDNQLLNLWTIVEILVTVERKNNFSKINQICNIVTSVLNAQYVISLIGQLLSDLQHCVSSVIQTELASVQYGKNDIEKMVAILVLPELNAQLTNILSALKDYPLLQYRIEHYSEIFSERTKIKAFLTTHRKRLSWHIMRIYRNRNMIVHDGSYFPYIDIIVQNLHCYIDCLIDTINSYAGKGYRSTEAIYTALQQQEYKYMLLLDEKDTNKVVKKIDADSLPIVLGYI